MPSLFDMWRVFWPDVVDPAHGFPWAPAFGTGTPCPPPPFASLDAIDLDLPTMHLRRRSADAGRAGTPVLIVGPYALHDASIADFAPGHSLAELLVVAGPVSLTHWKSATPEMRYFGIDTYLADLNVAVDDLGGRVALVGLCQGGWLAAAFAARFPSKVATLVVAGAPIDLGAAPSGITRGMAYLSPAALRGALAAFGGRMPGHIALDLWSREGGARYTARDALQCDPDPLLAATFDAWNRFTVDLPGAYFAQCAEWLFRENRLARGQFPALGRLVDLAAIEAPVFVIASSGDEIVTLAQATAIERLCPRAKVSLRVVEGAHLSIFMGRDTLAGIWTPTAAQIAGSLAPAPGRRRRQVRR